MADSQFINVMLLGLAFFLMFFSYQTSVFIQQTVVNSIKSKPEYNFHGDGYLSLCLTYMVFSISNWLSPSIIACTGLKYGMFIASLAYAIYPATFIYPTTVTFYLAAILTGLGAGPLWTAQGAYLARNSDEETAGRNAGLFWSIFQLSILFGNIFVYLAFNQKTTISDDTRYLVYGVLTFVCSLGVLVLLILRDKTKSMELDEKHSGAWNQFVCAFNLMRSPNILLLTISFIFTGQLSTFIYGVYGTALGATWQFGDDAKKYIGLAGVFMGIGEIVGGAIFGIMGKRVTQNLGREKVVVLGLVAAVIAFAFTYVNLPPDSCLVERAKTNPIIKPNLWLAMLCAGLMGFGDACFNTQIYAIIMSLFTGNSVPAFALSKFYHSLGAAIAFFLSTSLDLHYQIYLLIGGALCASVTFCIVEIKNRTSSTSTQRLTLPSNSDINTID